MRGEWFIAGPVPGKSSQQPTYGYCRYCLSTFDKGVNAYALSCQLCGRPSKITIEMMRHKGLLPAEHVPSAYSLPHKIAHYPRNLALQMVWRYGYEAGLDRLAPKLNPFPEGEEMHRIFNEGAARGEKGRDRIQPRLPKDAATPEQLSLIGGEE